MKFGALQLVVVLGAMVAFSPRAARADAEPKPAESKKQQAFEAKQASTKRTAAQAAAWHKKLNRRVGKRPRPPVNIYNKWTHEYLVFDAGDVKEPPATIANQFLRCHFTNEPTQMDQRLVGVLLQAAQNFKVQRVDVVSGFRDPKYNLTLRKKGRQVARNSEHTLGHAVDFRLPGVNIKRLHAWARGLRLGGVGFYTHSRFIHVDVGRVRYWNGS